MESKSKLFWTSGVLFMHVFVVTVLCQKKISSTLVRHAWGYENMELLLQSTDEL